MSDTITVTGVLGTEVTHTTTAEGLDVAHFRLASTQRRYDRATSSWVDGDTNWYTVTGFRQLARNAKASLEKGQRIVVTGRFRLREWKDGERSGLVADITADAIGHDLAWGTTAYTKVSRAGAGAAEAGEPAPAPVSAADEVPVPF